MQTMDHQKKKNFNEQISLLISDRFDVYLIGLIWFEAAYNLYSYG